MNHLHTDLTGIPLIDGHCHSIAADFLESSVETFQRIFTEAADPRIAVQHIPHTLTYRRAMPDYLPTHRREAGLRGMLVDWVYPPVTLSCDDLQAGLGAHYARRTSGSVLRAYVREWTLMDGEAGELAERIFFRNGLDLYRLDPAWGAGKEVHV